MVEKNNERLADRILTALQMAVIQEDVDIAVMLENALEMALTRGAGGKDFVERRDFSEDVESVLDKLEILRNRK